MFDAFVDVQPYQTSSANIQHVMKKHAMKTETEQKKNTNATGDTYLPVHLVS